MRKQLTTVDIQRALPDALGVFPLDKLPQVSSPLPIKLVANLQYSNLPGSHWVAVYRNSDSVGYYFDSFGVLPPLELQWWLSKHCKSWTWNKLVIQSPSDNVLCGYLCIEFLNNL